MTINDIIAIGRQIAAETAEGGNTAARVGGVIEAIGEILKNQDYMSWQPAGNFDIEEYYEKNDQVFDAETNSCYVSLQTDNVGHPVNENDESYEEGWWMKVIDGASVLAAAAAATQAAAEANQAAEAARGIVYQAVDDHLDTESLKPVANQVVTQAINNLFENLQDVEESNYKEIVSTAYQTLPCAISSSTGKWTASSSVDINRHILIPISEGVTYILKKNADTSYYQYAWLTNDTISAGNAAPLVAGTSVMTISDDNIHKIISPTGAKYIFIRTGYGETTALYPTYFGKLSNIVNTINTNAVAKEIDSTIYPSLPYAISPSTGKWTSATSSTTSRHTLIPVKEGRLYGITRSEQLGVTYAWLTNDSATAGGDAPLVPNTKAINTSSANVIISAPTGAKYLYIRISSGTTEVYYPQQVIEYVPQEEILKDLQEEADDIVEEDIQLNSNIDAWTVGVSWEIVTSTTGGMIIKLPQNAQFRIDAKQGNAAYYMLLKEYHTPINGSSIVGEHTARISVAADRSTGWVDKGEYNYLYIGMFNANGTNLSPQKVAIRHSLKDKIPSFVPQNTYVGNPLPLEEFGLKKTYSCEAFPTERIGYWDNTTNYAQQSLAIYNGLIFLFYHEGYCKVLDAETFEVLYSFQMNAEISHSNNHCGNSCFSEVFFNDDDEFPLLYMSNHLESKCYVLRIARDVNGGFSESSISVVQYIANAEGTEHNVYHFYPHGNTLICHYDVGNNQCYAVFNLPSINKASVETILLNYADRIDEFSFPRENHTAAGQVARNGRIFALMYGAGGTSPRYDLLFIYNFEKRVMDAKIHLTGRLARTEFEGVDVYDGKIYIGYNVTDQIGIIKTKQP